MSHGEWDGRALAEGKITGDRQNENAPLGDYERHPNMVVEIDHHWLLAPQGFTRIDFRIIAENAPSLQAKTAVGRRVEPAETRCRQTLGERLKDGSGEVE